MTADSNFTSFSDLFKLGREVLKTETFVLHEGQTRSTPSKKALVKCLFIFGLTSEERAQVGEDIRTFRKAKHSCILALQDVIMEPEVCVLMVEYSERLLLYERSIFEMSPSPPVCPNSRLFRM